MKMDQSQKHFAYIGSYADAASAGLHACRYNPETGELAMIDSVAGLANPTFLDVDPAAGRVYAIAERLDEQGRKLGAAAAFAIDPAAGGLSPLNAEVTVPAPTCHITLDRSRTCLMVASYHGGMVGLSPILEDGRVGSLADLHRHEGSSVLPVQSQARAHSVMLDPAGTFAAASDLGMDRVFIYRIDAEGRRMIPHGGVQIAPGSGPRHFVFHPSLPYGYVINELNATITAFAYDAGRGELREIQTVPTLPDDYAGENACADIHLSPDGRFLYGSNRGHDSIAVYALEPGTGLLTLVEHAPTLGGHPRNFAVSPDGRFVLVANRDTDEIVTFARNAENGKLTPTGSVLAVSKPVCIKFAVLE